MQILIVDDDPFMLNVLDHTLTGMGHKVLRASDGREALEILRRDEIKLVITDWEMPNLDGLEFCRTVRSEDFSGYVYIIVLTSREGKGSRREGMKAGADDFLNKPPNAEELMVCIKTAERILSLETRDVALFALAKLAESRDPETGGHLERVQAYTRLLATNLPAKYRAQYGIDAEYVHMMHQTSPLHDLGKVGIPDAVLLKRGKLTPGEFEVMKTHTILGAQTLDAALKRFPNAFFLRMARDIAVSHHEKFDGSGYPNALVGEQIPVCGRIVALADVYDALTSRRVYKSAMTHEQARAIILRDRGSHFDPEIVDAFLRAEEQFIAVRIRLSDELSAPIPEVAPPVASESSTCILAVEDSPIILNEVAKALRETGHPVYTASNAEQGMRLFNEYHPSVIVSDLEMPGGSGIDLCAQVRAHACGRAVHFLMLTVHSDEESLLEAYKAGVDDFVPKPFRRPELLARVRAGLRTCLLHDELAEKTAGLEAMNNQLAAMNGRLDKLSITDELTGLFNRRHAMVRLEEHWSTAERYNRPLSVAMFDLDHFKRVNDVHGHEVGDGVLQQLGAILREKTPGIDAVCRVGGEEFLVLFPSQTEDEARACAERCRLAVEKHNFNVGDVTLSMTISAGVAMRTHSTTQITDLLRMADRALYRAKHAGRNQVVCNDSEHDDMTTSAVPLEFESKAAGAPIDMESIFHRCGGDEQFVTAVVDRFRLQAPDEARRIEEAIAAGDADALRRTSHNLKGMSAYVTAEGAANLCRQMEEMARAGRPADAAPLAARLNEEIDRVNSWIASNSHAPLAKCA